VNAVGPKNGYTPLHDAVWMGLWDVDHNHHISLTTVF
jgi:hypothetical protein